MSGTTGNEATAAQLGETAGGPKGTLEKAGSDLRQAGSDVAAAASKVAAEAQSRAGSLAADVKDHVVSTVEGQREDLAGRLSDVADTVHKAGEQFKGNQDWIAQIVESGAGELGTLAETLRTNDLEGLMAKLQELARRQPAIFVGAAMAAGFAAVRVGKVAAAGASKSDLPSMPEVLREPK